MRCYQERSQLEKLVEVSHRAIAFHPRAPGIQQNLLHALALLGRFDEVIDAGFNFAARMFPHAASPDQWAAMKQDLKNQPEITKLAGFARQMLEIQQRMRAPDGVS